MLNIRVELRVSLVLAVTVTSGSDVLCQAESLFE